MSRLTKYRIKRIKQRLSMIKASFILTIICSLFFFSIHFVLAGSFSYFNASFTGDFSLQNAVKDHLVEITEHDLIYEEKCIAKKSITVKNIFDYDVKVTVGNVQYDLNPDEEIYHVQVVADN
jgi:hypothetical protein